MDQSACVTFGVPNAENQLLEKIDVTCQPMGSVTKKSSKVRAPPGTR